MYLGRLIDAEVEALRSLEIVCPVSYPLDSIQKYYESVVTGCFGPYTKNKIQQYLDDIIQGYH